MPEGPGPVPLIPYPGWLTGGAGKPGTAGAGAGGPAGGAGSTFTLPAELKAGLEDAWKDSFPKGTSQEQAGVLVQKSDGSLAWTRVVDGVSGTLTGGTASFDYGKLVGPGETLVAAAHTHPYDATEGGHENVSFSGGDFARMAVVADPQHFVRSGDSVFMMARTPEFDKLVAGTGAATLQGEINKTWNDTFAAAKGTLQERVETAVKAVSEKYHFDYYSGKGDTLTKVDTSK